jgi:hypothetical protein
MDGACSMKCSSEMHTKFKFENMKGGDLMEDVSVDVRTLKWILKKQGMKVLTGVM